MSSSLPEPIVTVLAPVAPPTEEHCVIPVATPTPVPVVIAEVEKEKEPTCCQVIWVVIALTLSGIAVGLFMSIVWSLRCVYQCDHDKMLNHEFRACTQTCLYGPPEPRWYEIRDEAGPPGTLGARGPLGPPGPPGPSMAEEVPALEETNPITWRQCMKICMGDDGYEYTDACKTKCQDVLLPPIGCPIGPKGEVGPKPEFDGCIFGTRSPESRQACISECLQKGPDDPDWPCVAKCGCNPGPFPGPIGAIGSVGQPGPPGPEPEEKPWVCPCGETFPHIH